jgi:hypothetical protein
VQKFGKKQFETNVLASLKKQGYTIVVLHDPNPWLKEQAEKAKKAAQAKAEKQAAMEQELADLKKQLAELKEKKSKKAEKEKE